MLLFLWIIIISVTFYLIGIYLLTKKMKRLEKDIGLLPEYMDTKKLNPVIGQNFHDFLSPLIVENYYLIIFSMPSCRVCEPGLEKLIKLQNKYGIIPIELIIFEGDTGIREFLKKYQEFFNIRVLPKKSRVFELIEAYPTYISINAKLDVIEQYQDEAMAYSALKEYTENYRKIGEIL